MDDRHARRRRRRSDPRRRPSDGFRVASLDRFSRLVELALDDLPDDLADQAEQLDIVVVDAPGDLGDGPVPLARTVRTSRGEPDRLELYRRPLESRAFAVDELRMLLGDVIEEELRRG